MVSDSSCSESSNSSQDRKKRRKSSKKRKHKEKKSKRDRKKEKCEKLKFKDRITTTHRTDLEEEQIETSTFGPALPTHLLQKQDNLKQNLIGPILPDSLTKKPENNAIEEEDDESETFGPLPMRDGLTSTQVELEQRALELKIAAIEGGNLQTKDVKTREEWMLELPEVGLRGGLAALSNMKRTFYQGKERPDFSDRSSWTKTPKTAEEDAKKSINDKKSAEILQLEAKAKYIRERDAEQERIANKHRKKQKRDESLLEIHQKKLRKEEKKKAKELAKIGAKPERRPFTRDIDLKLNKIDSQLTKQIVDKAKILNTKFSSGKAKYL